MLLVDIMPAATKPMDPLTTCNIMTYELGYVVNGLIYARHKRSWGDVKGAASYEANARINLADLVTQCQLLAEQMSWRWVDLCNDGVERFRERMKEIREHKL